MRKDIHIPEVTGVEIAVVLDKNEKDHSDEWGVYIINRKEVDLEMVVIVSQGFSETKKTSLFRRKIDVLPANSYSKFEVMQPELFALDNRFQVTFFQNNQLHDKTYIFQAETIQEAFTRDIDILGKKGIAIK
ncbi:Phenylalanyl-tRNA synthetase subunit alpha [Tenacibaculum sp. 190130A14a]|uniref:Phenylalanyl-tRNA synthetase subunit alpha n=1 Tax=Tenacibaculum polynesiense TaxID=3137857 RepID=A0ABP1EYQ6_9FLAO